MFFALAAKIAAAATRMSTSEMLITDVTYERISLLLTIFFFFFSIVALWTPKDNQNFGNCPSPVAARVGVIGKVCPLWRPKESPYLRLRIKMRVTTKIRALGRICRRNSQWRVPEMVIWLRVTTEIGSVASFCVVTRNCDHTIRALIRSSARKVFCQSRSQGYRLTGTRSVVVVSEGLILNCC